MSRYIFLGVALLLFLLTDIYLFKIIKTLTANSKKKTTIRRTYWIISIVIFVTLILYNWVQTFLPNEVKSVFMGVVFTIFIAKIFAILVLLMGDVITGTQWLIRKLSKKKKEPKRDASRSKFITNAALTTASIPLASMGYGILSGAYDYRIKHQTIFLPHLPQAFDGITIGQISDIHSGSFFNKVAVQGGVSMLLQQKPDLIFFTGDLVNVETKEVVDYLPIFSKLKAPLGVFSVLGNHDYGDYRSWSSPQAKMKNLKDMVHTHKILGWNLLLNENKILTHNKEKIAIIGVENWGKGRFKRYGKLEKAYQGTDEAAVKILLSHDPSHWDAQIRPLYNDIDITFSGHTHGFQFGIQLGNFRWSPSQYMYKQWSGLYNQHKQYLYVNVGFGFIGFPGRIGMPPEITLFTLKKGEPPIIS